MTSSLKDQAARWVDQGGGAEALNDWLQASPEHRRAYDQIDQTMRDPALVEAMRLHDARPKVVGLRPQARAGAFTRPVRGWTPALAAALVAGLLLAGVLSAPPLRERLYPVAAPRSPLLVVTAPGQLRTITLSDGSRIHLNGDTRLSLAQQGGGRHARLIRGEALFDIRHDPERPFVLALDHGSLTDLGTTFNVSILTTLLCILIGYPLAYFLSQIPRRYVGFFMLTVLLPFWTSLLVRTYAWLVMLQRNGLINNFAIDLGLWDTPLKLAHNLNGTLIGMVHIMLPFLILPLYAAMRRIDPHALQAAANLGATPVQAFWQIFVPLSLPGVVAGSLIVFVLSLGFYVTPAVLGGGKVILVSMQITAILEDQFNWGAASALGVVLLVLTFAALFLASRFLKLDEVMFGKR